MCSKLQRSGKGRKRSTPIARGHMWYRDDRDGKIRKGGGGGGTRVDVTGRMHSQ